MPAPALLLLVVLLAGPACVPGQAEQPGQVVELTDDNFDALTASGVWMVDVYAPWCSHCRQLEPVWEAFAADGAQSGIRVGKVDGTKNSVLKRRFNPTGYPSIYLLRDGQAWSYERARTVDAFLKFAVTDYRHEKAMPFFKAPNSFVGRALGLVYRLPALAQRAHHFLKHEKGFSDMAIISGTLLCPVAIGGLLICALDAYLTTQRNVDQHLHYE